MDQSSTLVNFRLLANKVQIRQLCPLEKHTMLTRLARAGPTLLARRPLALRALPTAKVAAIGISTFAAYSASKALCTPVAEHDDIDAAIEECIHDAISPRAQRARDPRPRAA